MLKWIFESIRYSSNIHIARKLIDENIQQIDQIVNSQGCSLLHTAADCNNLQALCYLFEAYNRQSQQPDTTFNKQNKIKWVNLRDNEGFTCLHYASFRHNMEVINILEQEGADIYLLNRDGLNCLHLAAQGGSPFIMYYFMGKGMKISSVDAKGNTPLHWASFMGMEHAVGALIAWGAEIDVQEHQHGMTPLHMGVCSGNNRVVRKLLLGGCDRSMITKKKQTALQLATEKKFPQIAIMIEDKVGLMEFLNLKPTFNNTQKRTLPYFFFIFLFTTTYLANIIYLIPFIGSQSDILTLIGFAFGLIILIQYFRLSCSDPGTLMPHPENNYFNMLKDNSPARICFQCNIARPRRSRHCSICKKCVMVYDHHCPWIGNCVGSRNYFQFFMFILALILYLTYNLIYHIANLFFLKQTDTNGIIVGKVVVSCYNLFISCLFITPITYLMVVQIKNCKQNKTTFQKYARIPDQKHFHMKQIESIAKETQLLDKKKSHSQTNPSIFSDNTEEKVRKKLQQQPSIYQNCMAMCFENRNNPHYDVL